MSNLKMSKKNSIILKRVFIMVSLFCLSYLVSLTLVSNPFSNRLPLHDSSMFQYFGYAMSKGDLLYVDIFDHKGPIIFLINYIATIMPVDLVDGIWFIEFIAIFGFFFWTYRTARFWNNRILSFIPIVFFSVALPSLLEGGNLTEEFALPFIAYSLYVFTKYFLKEDSVRFFEVVLVGASFTVSFLLRPNLIGVWIIFCSFIFFGLLFKKKNYLLAKFLFSFIGGILIVIIPILFYLIANNSLEDAFFQTWTFNFLYSETDSIQSFESMMTLLGIMNNYNFILVVSLYLGFIVMRWKRFQSKEKFIHLIAFLSIIISSMLTFMSGRAYQHYLMALLPVLTIPISALLSVININSKINLKSLFIVLLLSLGLSVPIYRNYVLMKSMNTETVAEKENRTRYSNIEKNIRNYAKERENMTDISEWIQSTTEITDRIYTHRLAGNIYLQSQRLSSIKYFNLPAVNLDKIPQVGIDFYESFINSDTKLVIVKDSFITTTKNSFEEQFYQYLVENYVEHYRKDGNVGFLKKE